MSYLSSPWNHLRAIRAWAQEHGAETAIDASSFRIEIRAHNRYFTLHPKFFASNGPGWHYVSELSADGITGFAGWLPYRSIQWPLSSDKRLFDSFVRRCGLRRPDVWPEGARPRDWYLIKGARGSFGDQVSGPFAPQAQAPDVEGETFRESYIPGRALKVWYWGSRPFFAHVQERPEITGDGVRPIRELLPSADSERRGDDATLVACLAFQGVAPESVLPSGKRVWIDFRYGRRLAPQRHSTASDDALGALPAQALEQIDRLGAALSDELEGMFGVPVLCSADGVLDADHQVWWLEANSNPALPPEGYPLVLGTLFPPAPHASGLAA